MAIQILSELNERLVSVAAAGVEFAAEDFRLREILEKLAPMRKVPVFDAIGKLLEELITDGENRSIRFLELINLTRAVRVTQAESHAEPRDVIAVQPDAVHIPKLGYQESKLVTDALTSSGSGRFEILKDAEKSGILQDHRFMRSIVGGIRDSYCAIADFCTEHVIKQGKGVLPVLLAEFDPHGKKGDVRILNILARLAGAAQNELYLKLAEETRGDMQIEAIKALRFDIKNEAYLTEKAAGKRSGKWYFAALMGMPSETAMRLAWDGLTEANYYAYQTVLREKVDSAVGAFLGDRMTEIIERLPSKAVETETDTARRLALILSVLYYQDTSAVADACHTALLYREKLSKCDIIYNGWKQEFLSELAIKLMNSNNPVHCEFLYSLKSEKRKILLRPELVAYIKLHGVAGAYDEFGKDLAKCKYDHAVFTMIQDLLYGREGYERPFNGVASVDIEEFIRDKRWIKLFMQVDASQCVLAVMEKDDPVEKYFDELYYDKADRNTIYSWTVANRLLDIESAYAEKYILRAIEDLKSYDNADFSYRNVISRLDSTWKSKLLKAVEKAEKKYNKVSSYYGDETFIEFIRNYAQNL